VRKLPSFEIEYHGHEFRRIKNEAKRRGVTIQSVLRCIVIPEWLKKNVRS